MTGLAQVLFPWRANGSLVTDEKGQVIGSELIAQGFANPAYFQPRPSAAGEKGYDAASFVRFQSRTDVEEAAGSHQRRSETAQEENPDATGPVPAELVTTSGSGLDPDLSPAGDAVAGAASCQSARRHRGTCEGRRRFECGRANLRHLRRTPSQRAVGQFGARSAVRQSDSASSGSGKEKDAKEASPDNKGGTQSAAPAEKP